MRLWRRHRLDLGAVALLWGLCFLYLWRLFSPIRSLRLHVVAGDFTNQFYPFRYFAASEWHAGRVPLWNPYVFAGHPFLADVQTAVFYPLSLANSLLGAVVGFSPTMLELEMAVHYPLAALFTYLLGRQLLGSRFGAIVAAVVFTFGGFLTSYPAQQLAMLETAVWLPLILLCLERAVVRPSSGYRWHLAAGLLFGVSILAGHSQTALFIVYTSLAYLALRALAKRDGSLRTLVGAVVFLVVGFGLAAVQVLPTAEFLGLSTRASMTYEAAAHGYERRALLGILLPNWRGEKALYVGVLPLALAGLTVVRAAVAARRGRGRSVKLDSVLDPSLALGLGVLALVSVLLSLGGQTPLFRPLYLYAPGFSLFRDQERIIYLFTFAASLLAGAGTADLYRLGAKRAAQTRWLWLGVAVGLALALVGAAALVYLSGRRPDIFDPFGSLGGCLVYFVGLALLGAAALLSRRYLRRDALFGGLVVGVVVADLFAVNLGNNLSPVNPDPTPRFAPLVAAMLPMPEDFRVRGENDAAFPPNYAAVWGVPTINGDTPFALQRVSDFLFAPGAEWRRWQALNVKFFLSSNPPFDGVELAYDGGDLKVYRVVYSMPRAWAVRDAQVASDPADALKRLLDPKLHPGDTVVLEEPPSVGPLVKGDRPDVRIVSYGPQRVEIDAKGDGAAMLVLADTYYPGWKAYRDGAPVEIYRANYVTRAVDLPPGEHHFEFVFDPLSFKLGALLSALTLLVGAAGLWLASRRARRLGVLDTLAERPLE